MLLRGGKGANVIQPEEWENLKNAIWSNKTSFILFSTSDRIYIRRTPSRTYDPECLPPRRWRGFIHGIRTRVVVFCRTHHYPASLTAGLHHWQRQCEHFQRWGPKCTSNRSSLITWSQTYSALVVGVRKRFSITLSTSIIIKRTCHCFTGKMGQDSLTNYTRPLLIHSKKNYKQFWMSKVVLYHSQDYMFLGRCLRIYVKCMVCRTLIVM